MENEQREIERAKSLMNLKRHEEAIKILEQVHLKYPEDLEALILLSLCYLELSNKEKAAECTQKVIALAPDYAWAYYYRAHSFLISNKPKEAEETLWEAIKFDPDEASFYGLMSNLFIYKQDWKKALEFAEMGLGCGPENTFCLNHKTLCLTKLNRAKETEEVIQNALHQDPYNAYTHANVGWAKLEQGNVGEANKFFLESLRLNPTNEHAKAGLVEALKAKNWFYKKYLDYSFWMANKKQNVQWIIIILFVVGRSFLLQLASEFPLLYGVVILLLIFTYITWLIRPLSNSFLLFDKFGKYALDEDQKTSAWVASFCFLSSLVAGFLGWYFDILFLMALAVFMATIAIPVTQFYETEEEQRGLLLKSVTAGLFIFGIICLALIWLIPAKGIALGSSYFTAFVIYTWSSSFLKKSN